MISNNDIEYINVSSDDIQSAINYARDNCFIDNLRKRTTFVQFDSKVRGHLGELAIKKIFEGTTVDVVKTDSFIDNSFEDIDITLKNETTDGIVLEIKTSMLPDVWKNINTVINNADIKIIKRENSYEQIRADFHIQIYFGWLRKQRDTYLESISGDIKSLSNEELVTLLHYDNVVEMFVCWIDKNSLISYLRTTNPKTWSFGYKTFWKCPLYIANKPQDLLSEIINYTK